jgi:DNA-nicking Smr family endonuclease
VVKKTKDQLSDEQLFRQEMDGVVPLVTPLTTESKVPRNPNRKHRPATQPVDFNGYPLRETDDHSPVNAADASSHRKNGIQNRVIQKLKRGHFPVRDQLDLHHMTTDKARAVLLEFIRNAQRKSLGCVRVIHGKGLRSENGPRLKVMTHQVLHDHPHVLAFIECKPADGGTGAVDVLLKTV